MIHLVPCSLKLLWKETRFGDAVNLPDGLLHGFGWDKCLLLARLNTTQSITCPVPILASCKANNNSTAHLGIYSCAETQLLHHITSASSEPAIKPAHVKVGASVQVLIIVRYVHMFLLHICMHNLLTNNYYCVVIDVLEKQRQW